MTTKRQARSLGLFLASVDERDIPDIELFAEAWSEILHDAPFSDVIDAVIDHYRRTSDMIYPCEIREAICINRNLRDLFGTETWIRYPEDHRFQPRVEA